MRKRILALLLCAVMGTSLCACTSKPAAPADPVGQSSNDPAADTTDAYAAFLAGDGVVYADRLAENTPDSTEMNLETGRGYSFLELMEAALERQSADFGAVEMASALAAEIDCGRDGVPELAVRATIASGAIGDITEEYIIKDFDGTLQICCITLSAYRSMESLVNPYGLINSSGSNSAFSYTDGYAYVNADGEYVFLYSCESEYALCAYSGIGNRLYDVILQHEEDISVDDWCLESYAFSDPAEFDFENHTFEEYCETLTYSTYPDEDPLIGQIFAEADIPLHTQSEMESMILSDAEAKGISRELFENRDDIAWKVIENDALNDLIAYGADPVFVDTTDAFIRAIANGANIVLAPGTYNVTQYLREKQAGLPYFDSEGFVKPGVLTYGYYTEPELVVHGIHDLHITSQRGGEMAQIVCEPRYAQVITFDCCDTIRLENVVMGHTIEPGVCSGDVVCLQECEDVSIKGCDLYGCGAYGLYALDCGSIRVDNTVIHDCSYGCAEMYRTTFVSFRNCTFRDCQEFDMFNIYSTSADFYDCTFRNLQGNMLEMDDSGFAYFSNCLFDNDSLLSLQSYSGSGTVNIF